jgi:hypothetical protein
VTIAGTGIPAERAYSLTFWLCAVAGLVAAVVALFVTRVRRRSFVLVGAR